MNTQAIKIIDDIMSKLEQQADMINTYDLGGYNYLSKVKEKISSLHSLDIDSLQRYSCGIDEWYQPNMNKSDDGEYIRYDDLLNLLKNDK